MLLLQVLWEVNNSVEIIYLEVYMQMPSLNYDIVTEMNECGQMGMRYMHKSHGSMTLLMTPLKSNKLNPSDKDTQFEFGLLSASPKLVVNNWTWQCHGNVFFNFGSTEEHSVYMLVVGVVQAINIV
ncbi:hypothetical protein B0H21DRAFT_823606 [Amylocystis lapponica]|nr:hypothetical protein B0H21DRAFT_823606 [Amylocystis lapponica]